MPVRGMRSIWPSKGRPPTGIFGQPQKMDPVNFPNEGAQKYAKGSSTRSKPKGSGGQSLRHQKPKRGY